MSTTPDEVADPQSPGSCAAKCEVHGHAVEAFAPLDGFVEPGAATDVTVTVKDSHGNPCEGKVEVLVGDTKAVVSSADHGLYEATFDAPATKGHVRVSVRVDGKDIGGSPFELNIGHEVRFPLFRMLRQHCRSAVVAPLLCGCHMVVALPSQCNFCRTVFAPSSAVSGSPLGAPAPGPPSSSLLPLPRLHGQAHRRVRQCCTVGRTFGRSVALWRRCTIGRSVAFWCRIAPHRIASNRLAPHRVASHRIASRRVASHRITCAALHRLASRRVTSHRIASHSIASHQLTADQNSLHRIASRHIHHTGLRIISPPHAALRQAFIPPAVPYRHILSPRLPLSRTSMPAPSGAGTK